MRDLVLGPGAQLSLQGHGMLDSEDPGKGPTEKQLHASPQRWARKG